MAQATSPGGLCRLLSVLRTWSSICPTPRVPILLEGERGGVEVEAVELDQECVDP